MGTGLRDESGRAGTSLGQHLESRSHWALNANLVIEAGWSFLIKGSYTSNLRNLGIVGTPTDHNSTYTWSKVNLKF